jgi:hypothetical protein
MLNLLSPGDLLSDTIGLPKGEDRVIFRMLINTIVWGAIGVGAVLVLVV